MSKTLPRETTGRRRTVTDHFTPSEFAAAVGHDVATVRRWLRSKHVRGRRVGDRGFWWIPPSEVERISGKPAVKAITPAEASAYLDNLMAGIRAREQQARQAPAS